MDGKGISTGAAEATAVAPSTRRRQDRRSHTEKQARKEAGDEQRRDDGRSRRHESELAEGGSRSPLCCGYARPPLAACSAHRSTAGDRSHGGHDGAHIIPSSPSAADSRIGATDLMVWALTSSVRG